MFYQKVKVLLRKNKGFAKKQKFNQEKIKVLPSGKILTKKFKDKGFVITQNLYILLVKV